MQDTFNQGAKGKLKMRNGGSEEKRETEETVKSERGSVITKTVQLSCKQSRDPGSMCSESIVNCQESHIKCELEKH